MIDVPEECVDRVHALRETAATAASTPRHREDARNDVERYQPLGIAAFGIDREGDADPAEQQLGLGARASSATVSAGVCASQRESS